MMRLFTSFCLLFALAVGGLADKVVIQIEAKNPDSQARAVQVKSYLPTGIRKHDVLRTSGLSVDYDVRRAAYYAHAELELAAGRTVSLEVELNDIWVIPPETLDELQEHAGRVMLMLRSDETRKKGTRLADAIRTDIIQIRDRQASAALPAATVEQHVQAFLQNDLLFHATVERVAELEALVLSDKRDPGKLLGIRTFPPRLDTAAQTPTYGQVKLTVTANNPSPTKPRVMDIKHYLPREISVKDIVDPGNLEVRTDVEDGLCFLYKEKVTVPPTKFISFDVLILDKWNVNSNRIVRLHTKAAHELGTVQKWARYPSVEQKLVTALKRLQAITATPTPQTVNEEYVAFYRDQAGLLDIVESDIEWVSHMIRTKVIEPLDDDMRKAVWVLIYIILGFLAVVTLLVIAHSQKSRYT